MKRLIEKERCTNNINRVHVLYCLADDDIQDGGKTCQICPKTSC